MLAQPGRIEMHMDIDGAGRGDHSFAVTHGRRRRNDEAGIDAIHDRRITGLAEADYSAVLDAEVALNNADHWIDDENVAEEKIEGALSARYTGR